MDRIVEYKDLKGEYVLVDVRSPGEYKESHIPGAVNIPLFSDEERAIVGTVYVQESQEKAKQVGIEFVSQNLPNIFEKYTELKNRYNSVVIYCARGGMRSGSIFSLLSSLKYNVYKLRGGFKEYRNIVLQGLNEILPKVKFIVLHGYTGVGKTQILKKLESIGHEVLDLEGYANHRGSILGNVGLGGQPSQKMFEAFIFEKLRNRKSDIIFVEAESKRIGKLNVPEPVTTAMSMGTHVLLEADIDIRARRVVEEYIKDENSKQELINGIEYLSKYIGHKNTEKLITFINEGNFIDAAKELMILHYDPTYGHVQKNYNYEITINADDFENACNELVRIIK